MELYCFHGLFTTVSVILCCYQDSFNKWTVWQHQKIITIKLILYLCNFSSLIQN